MLSKSICTLWMLATLAVLLPIPPEVQGNQLTFTSARNGQFDVWTVGVDGNGVPIENPIPIASAGSGSEARGPDWSTLDRIAYQSGRSGARSIHLVKPDGTGNVRLTPPPSTGGVCPSDARDPSWSHDGRFIAYACLVGTRYALWIHDTNGTPDDPTGDQDYSLFSLANASALRPTWSPDGTKIAFVAGSQIAVATVRLNKTSNRQEIFGNAVNLTNNSFINFDPTWSPDGQQIAYSTTRNGGRDIYRMSATNGEDDPPCTGCRLTSRGGDNINPAWSPDGRLIAFVSDRAGNREIYVMSAVAGDAATSSFVRVTNDPFEDNDPAWPPDTDGDGLPDRWETDGIDIDGDGIIDLELYDVNQDGIINASERADPLHKDIYVEVDYMQAADHNHRPNIQALAAVKVAFAAAPVSNPDNQPGIRLHVMVDDAMPEFTPLQFNNDPIQQTPAAHFENLKSIFFGTLAEKADPNSAKILPARKRFFRYAIFGHDHAHNIGASGKAEIGGNDFLITLRYPSYNQKAKDAAKTWGTTISQEWADLQAGTFMHELGHTLGLHHGGRDEINCKPNYLSVMRYGHQWNEAGLSFNLPDVANYIMVRTNRPLSYSVVRLDTLKESLLKENDGIGGPTGLRTLFGVMGDRTVGPTKGAIDWNGNNQLESSVNADINHITDKPACPISPGQSLVGYDDDWSSLDYNFRDSPYFADGEHQSASSVGPEETDVNYLEGFLGMPDFDGDGVSNVDDNCPHISNVDQTDSDKDGVGDVCDNCPATFNLGQDDSDGNGVGDACDTGTSDGCPEDPNKTEPGVCGCGVPDTDSDNDGVSDCHDNCPAVANPGQQDNDGDGVGDACENEPPVAKCQNVTAPTETGTCSVASASVNNGSFDPDGDQIFLVQSPVGPYPLGPTTVTLTVTDSKGASASCSATVTVIDQTPPAITCPGNQTAECTRPNGAAVSFSPTVADNCSVGVPSCTPASGSTFPIGSTPISCSATDGSENSSDCSSAVTVQDTTAPVISAVAASPNVLWPPNHKMTPVTVAVSASDICDAAPVCEITSVSSNEPVNGTGNGDKEPDWQITGNLTVNLRAERAGSGSGRVYTVTVACSDASQNSSTKTTTVTVPHNQ